MQQDRRAVERAGYWLVGRAVTTTATLYVHHSFKCDRQADRQTERQMDRCHSIHHASIVSHGKKMNRGTHQGHRNSQKLKFPGIPKILSARKFPEGFTGIFRDLLTWLKEKKTSMKITGKTWSGAISQKRDEGEKGKGSALPHQVCFYFSAVVVPMMPLSACHVPCPHNQAVSTFTTSTAEF